MSGVSTWQGVEDKLAQLDARNLRDICADKVADANIPRSKAQKISGIMGMNHGICTEWTHTDSQFSADFLRSVCVFVAGVILGSSLGSAGAFYVQSIGTKGPLAYLAAMNFILRAYSNVTIALQFCRSCCCLDGEHCSQNSVSTNMESQTPFFHPEVRFAHSDIF